jgi:hypothetical protein
MTEATPATQAWLADAVAAVHLTNQARERQQLIHDLANSNPYVTFSIQGNASGSFCRHCNRPNSGTQVHADDCLWVRANRLIDGTETG